MTIKQALMTYLLASPGVYALVGTRVRYSELQEDDQMPAICIIGVSDVKSRTHDGQLEVETPNIQVTCYDTTELKAELLSDAVKLVLNDHHGIMSGLVVQDIQLLSEGTGPVSVADPMARIYATDLEYEITYEKE